MLKRRVLFLRAPSLLAEGLEELLRRVKEIELIGPWDLTPPQLTHLSEVAPDVVLIADEEAGATEAGFFVSRILEEYPDLPVVQIGMRQNTIRLYTSQALPARTIDLLDLIRHMPVRPLGQANLRLGDDVDALESL